MKDIENKSRAELIKEMLAMQKKFIAKDQDGGISQEQLYSDDADDGLGDYQARYTALANRLVEIAHTERGSRR